MERRGLLLIGILLYCHGSYAYHSGAPESVCPNANLFPSGHGVAGSNDPSPYFIEVAADQYAAKASLKITLTGSQSFKGFAILAVRYGDNSNNDPVGSFEVEDSANSNLVQALCSGKGLTHTATYHSSPKSKLVLKWNAPNTIVGNIIFHATFVETKTVFWVKVPSSPIWDGVGPRPVTTTPSAATDPPPITAVSPTGCGDSKSCYHDCKNGDKECGFLLTWTKKDNNMVEFELFGSLTERENYIAVGLAPRAEMFDVTIISCSADSRRNSLVEQYYAKDRSAPGGFTQPLAIKDSIASIQTAATPKTMSCRFTYDNNIAASDSKLKDLNEPFYAFIARGPYSGALGQHFNIPTISPNQIDFLSDKNILVTGAAVQGLVKAHACIMIVAWVFCASVGLILARYYKPMWEDTKACGQKVWFSYHRALMLTAMFLTIIGFICILIFKKGIFSVEGLELPHKAHPILGLIAIICALLNPLIAAFRCHPGDSKRPIFNWIHWFFGTVAHVFAICSIATGTLFERASVPQGLWYAVLGYAIFHVTCALLLEMHTRFEQPNTSGANARVVDPHTSTPGSVNEQSQVVAIFLGMLFQSVTIPTWTTYIMMAFCLFHVCVEFILEIHQCCMYDKNRDRQEMQKSDGSGPKYAGRGFKCAMLALYMVVVSCITIALVVIVAVWGSTAATS